MVVRPQIQIKIKIAVGSVPGLVRGRHEAFGSSDVLPATLREMITGLIWTDDGRQHRLRSLTYSTVHSWHLEVVKVLPNSRRAAHAILRQGAYIQHAGWQLLWVGVDEEARASRPTQILAVGS